MGAPLTCSCDDPGCCETPVSHRCDTHADGADFSEATRLRAEVEGHRRAQAAVFLALGPDADPDRDTWPAQIEKLRRVRDAAAAFIDADDNFGIYYGDERDIEATDRFRATDEALRAALDAAKASSD